LLASLCGRITRSAGPIVALGMAAWAGVALGHGSPADPQLDPEHQADAPIPGPDSVVAPPAAWQVPAVLVRDGVVYYLVEDGPRFVREQLPPDAAARVLVTRGVRPWVQFDIVADPDSGSGQSVRVAPFCDGCERVVLTSMIGQVAFGGGVLSPLGWRLGDLFPSSTPWGDPNDTDPRSGRPVRGAEDFSGPIDGVYSPGYRSVDDTPLFREPVSAPLPEDQALAALARGDHRAAAAYFEEVLRYEPTHASARRWLGIARMAGGDLAAGAAEVGGAYRAEPALARRPLPVDRLGPRAGGMVRGWATGLALRARAGLGSDSDGGTVGASGGADASLAHIMLLQSLGELDAARRVLESAVDRGLEARVGPEVVRAWREALRRARP
jgi:hypothetical protein